MLALQACGPEFDPQDPSIKAKCGAIHFQPWGGRDRQSPGACWPTGLVYCASSCLKKIRWTSPEEWHMRLSSVLHTHVYMYFCIHRHTWTHIQGCPSAPVHENFMYQESISRNILNERHNFHIINLLHLAIPLTIRFLCQGRDEVGKIDIFLILWRKKCTKTVLL